MNESKKEITDDLKKKFDIEKANCVNELTNKFESQLNKKDNVCYYCCYFIFYYYYYYYYYFIYKSNNNNK